MTHAYCRDCAYDRGQPFEAGNADSCDNCGVEVSTLYRGKPRAIATPCSRLHHDSHGAQTRLTHSPFDPNYPPVTFVDTPWGTRWPIVHPPRYRTIVTYHLQPGALSVRTDSLTTYVGAQL